MDSSANKAMPVAFRLDVTNLQWPPPGSFEANILRTIDVPYQRIDTSGGQYPPPQAAERTDLPAFTIDWEQVGPITISLPAEGR
jgi:hypothetical protein